MRIRRLSSGLPSDCRACRPSGSGAGDQDQARLIFTVSAGAVAGRRLWSIDPSRSSSSIPTDTFALARRIRSTLAVGFGGTYFPGDNLGFAVEGFLIGLGFEDSCRHLFSSGSGEMADSMPIIQGAKKSATRSVALTAGRSFASTAASSSHLTAGPTSAWCSATRARSRTGRDSSRPLRGLSDLIVYSDDHNSESIPRWPGWGLPRALPRAINLRWEVRDNIVGVQQVTGPSPLPDSFRPTSGTFKHLFSMTSVSTWCWSEGGETVLKRGAGTAVSGEQGRILAGGGATRFGGRPKGLELVGGERILDRLVRVMTSALGEPPLLVANAPDAAHWRPDLRTVSDVRPGLGALGGIYTAVVEAPAPVVCVAWDMPFVSESLIRALADGLERHDAVLPESGGRRGVEPLCAALWPRLRRGDRDGLAAGDLRAIGFHDRIRVGILPLDEVRGSGRP